MYSLKARRSDASPNRMSLDKHSSLTERTQRSATALDLGSAPAAAKVVLLPYARRRRRRWRTSRISLAHQAAGALVGRVPRHLQHPLRCGMSRNTGEGDSAGFQLDEEQHVVGGETSPGQNVDREEIRASQDRHVCGNEFLPGGLLGPLRCRRDAMVPQNVPHRLIGNMHAEMGERSDNAGRIPSRSSR